MDSITLIEYDLIAWERSHYSEALLDNLQCESLPALRMKSWQLRQLDQKDSRTKYRYIDPSTLTKYQKAIRHELHRRAWYWSTLEFFELQLLWYFLKFRNQWFKIDKYYGIVIEDAKNIKNKWWQEDMPLVLKHPFFRLKFSDIIIIFLTLLTLIFTVYTYCNPRK